MFKDKKTIAFEAIKVGVNVGFFINPDDKHPEIKHGCICGKIIKDAYDNTNSENPTPVTDIEVAGVKTPDGKSIIKAKIPINYLFPVSDEELAQWVGNPPAITANGNDDGGTPPTIPSDEGSASNEGDSTGDSNAEAKSHSPHFDKHKQNMQDDPEYRNKVQNDGEGGGEGGGSNESDAIPTDTETPKSDGGGAAETIPTDESKPDNPDSPTDQNQTETQTQTDDNPSADQSGGGESENPPAEKPPAVKSDSKEPAKASKISEEGRNAHVRLYTALIEVIKAGEACTPHIPKKVNAKQLENFVNSANRMGTTLRADFDGRGLGGLLEAVSPSE